MGRIGTNENLKMEDYGTFGYDKLIIDIANGSSLFTTLVDPMGVVHNFTQIVEQSRKKYPRNFRNFEDYTWEVS